MKLWIFLGLLTTLNYSCSSQDLTGRGGKTDSAKTPSTVKISPETPNTKDAIPPTDLGANPIIPPSVIAGASLTCRVIAGGAECETREIISQAKVELPAIKFYLINAVDLKWVETEYKRTAPGVYQILTTLSNYAIGLSNTKNEIAATWVVPPPANLLRNGSFEDYPLLLDPLVTSKQGDPWQAQIPVESPCTVAWLDVNSNDTKNLASEGVRYLDLNSYCNDDVKHSKNIAIQNYQAHEGHLYQLVYQYAANPDATFEHNLEVMWSGESVGSHTLVRKDLTWIEQSVLQFAKGDSHYVAFQDKSDATDSRGALLDNVRLYDLGIGPEKP